MRRLSTMLAVILTGLVLVASTARADVFAHNVRITQPATTAPFDGKFTDGTAAAIRFTLSDHADSVLITIKNGATTVRTIKALNLTLGDTLVFWDGKDDANSNVTTGTYTLTIATYDKGYAGYKMLAYPDAAGLSQRGMTTITNPALKNFGFIFDVDNGGHLATVGAARYSADAKPWGSVQGNPKLNTTGLTLGPSEARWGTQADKDGYVYVAGRTNKQILRYNSDSLVVGLADTNYGAYYPFSIGIRENPTGSKTVAVVVNNNSGTATLTGDSRVLSFTIPNANATNLAGGGVKDTVLKGNGTVAFWDVTFGRDSIMYAAFIYPADAGRSGIAKFNLAGKTLPLTLADTVWTARVDSGRVGSCHYYVGADVTKDRLYFVNARIASGNPPLTAAVQGIYVLSGLGNARPTQAVAYPDSTNNASITKSDVSTDPVGNLVYFENSNEEIVTISPPTGPNSYTYNALSSIKVFDAITIAQARVDADGNFQPDSVGKTVTVVGIINMLNTQGAAGLQFDMQDETGGIMLFKSGAANVLPLKIGDRVLVTGVLQYFRGATEITPVNVATDVTVLDQGNVLVPKVVTIPEIVKNGEKYEAQLIKIVGIGKKPTSPAWPALGADANFMGWDGWDSLVVRIDKDCDVDGSTEPVYPMTVTGVCTQFTSSSSIHNDGYQITPSVPGDIVGNVPVPPNPHFALMTPANGSTVKLDSAAQQVKFTWKRGIDLNAADTLIYQWIPVGFSAVITGTGGRDTFIVRTGTQMLTYLGTKDTVVLKWTVKTKDPANPLVNNSDTVSVTVVRGLLTGVEEAGTLPADYALEQNFPNPFNPTTTIRVSLPLASSLTVTVYNMLGQQVATVFDGSRPAGISDMVWNGKDNNDRTVASGVYLYRVVARSNDGLRTFVQNRKMMMLK